MPKKQNIVTEKSKFKNWNYVFQEIDQDVRVLPIPPHEESEDGSNFLTSLEFEQDLTVRVLCDEDMISSQFSGKQNSSSSCSGLSYLKQHEIRTILFEMLDDFHNIYEL